MASHTLEVVETDTLEGKFLGILVAEEVFHSVDRVLQSQTILDAELSFQLQILGTDNSVGQLRHVLLCTYGCGQ